MEMRIEKAREERGDNREHTAHWEELGPKGDPWHAKLNGPGPDPKGVRGAWGGTARNAGHQIANGTLRQTYAHARHADTRTDR